MSSTLRRIGWSGTSGTRPTRTSSSPAAAPGSRRSGQEGGLAGFPERAESEHDAFGVGHASTAVSAALGMVEGRRLSGDPGKVVALVGDGALTGGMAFEGLNQAGYLKSDLLVVLNDNEMSISPNVGAISEWLSKRLASPSTARLKQIVKAVLQDAPHGQETIEALRRGLDAAKTLFTPGMLFEALGFEYVGPVDGHDVAGLVGTLRRLALLHVPVLLHALTKKGKGYPPAETDAATRGHALSFFDPKTGRSASRGSGPPPYTDVFADALCAEMERDPTGRRDHRGHARGNRPRPVQAALPRTHLRRRHRGAARRHVRRRARLRGVPPGRRHLLHLPAARVRPDRPRRGAAAAAGDVRARPRRARRGRRQDSPGRLRRELPPRRARARGHGAVGRERPPAHAPHRARAARPRRAAVPAPSRRRPSGRAPARARGRPGALAPLRRSASGRRHRRGGGSRARCARRRPRARGRGDRRRRARRPVREAARRRGPLHGGLRRGAAGHGRGERARGRLRRGVPRGARGSRRARGRARLAARPPRRVRAARRRRPAAGRARPRRGRDRGRGPRARGGGAGGLASVWPRRTR